MTAWTPDEVKALRKAAGLKQREAAAVVGVDLRTWQRYEEGSREPSAQVIELFRLKIASKKPGSR